MPSEQLLENIRLFSQDPKNWPVRAFAKKAEEIEENLEIHAEGEWSDRIMDLVRPNEDDACKTYRRDVWKSPVKSYFSKVVKNLAKIRKAEDWQIDFNDENQLQKYYKEYCEKNFPFDDSVENWAFNVLFNHKFKDPNAICAIYPRRKPVSDQEYFQPYCYIYETKQVLYCIDNELYVLLEEEKSIVKNGDKEEQTGLIIKFIDRNEIVTIYQYGQQRDYTFTISEDNSFVHNFGFAPAFKLSGVPYKTNKVERIYESFLTPCLDSWDEAARRYSDVQVNYALHMNPERWEVQDTECPTCNGSGIQHIQSKVKGGEDIQITCKTCNGSGSVSTRSPFNVKLIKVAQKNGPSDSVQIPTPPLGYVSRDTKVIELQNQEVEKKIFEGLAAVNQEYLMNSPLVNSGVAKAYDKEEANSFAYTVMCDFIDNNLKPTYYFISKWLFGAVASESEIMAMQPNINKAKKFDFINSNLLTQRVQAAKDAGFSQSLVMSMQIQYAKYDMGEDSDDYKYLKSVYELDPFAGKSTDEKLAMSSTGTVDKDLMILSDNINWFVQKAFEENDKFYELEFEQQLEVLMKYVEETKSKNKQVIVPIE